MALFSRAFVRKRVISLATTATVAATSLALAQDPTSAYHVRGAMPIQYVAYRPDLSVEQAFLSENDAAMNKMITAYKAPVAPEDVGAIVDYLVRIKGAK